MLIIVVTAVSYKKNANMAQDYQLCIKHSLCPITKRKLQSKRNQFHTVTICFLVCAYANNKMMDKSGVCGIRICFNPNEYLYSTK